MSHDVKSKDLGAKVSNDEFLKKSTASEPLSSRTPE